MQNARIRRATPTQRLLTLRQAAEQYGIPQRSLHDLITRGVLPSVRFGDGRRLWLDRRDIEAAIEAAREVRQ
ncbi:MAG TPA: helix-turn-helix domain-containing protein [Vicinamibacterales bacterium]